MEARDIDRTAKARERERLAADVAEFLRRGGVIEVASAAPPRAPQKEGRQPSPVSVRDSI